MDPRNGSEVYRMKIPKQFKLMGRTITVKHDPSMHYEGENLGYTSYRQNKICIQPSSDSIPAPPELVEHTFCHELVHFILYFAGEDQFSPPLHQREYLVDRIAGLLHQALTTMEYE